MRSEFIITRETEIPAGLEQLVQASLEEGVWFVRVLRDQWNSGANRFSKPGEALFAARNGDSLAGVCGLNRDPHSADPEVGRLHRLFVTKPFRRQGVGTALISHVMHYLKAQGARVLQEPAGVV